MPKYFCHYCDTHLTHDSPSVRKTHNGGRKHKDSVRMYYQQWMEEQAQKMIDATAKAFEQGKIPCMGPQGMMPRPPMGAMVPPPANYRGMPPMHMMNRPGMPMYHGMPQHMPYMMHPMHMQGVPRQPLLPMSAIPRGPSSAYNG